MLFSAVLESVQMSELQVVDAFVSLKHWSVTSAKVTAVISSHVKTLAVVAMSSSKSSTELLEVAVGD